MKLDLKSLSTTRIVWSVPFTSLLVTYLFFFEYLPPFKRFHITYDLPNFMYPLLDHAFLSLKAGRFPEWDPAIYCGMSFVGNIQAALFYPLNWLLFAVNWPYPRLQFQTLEILVILHVWLAFVFSYSWLKRQGAHGLACAVGASAFAFGGYTMIHLQHMGIVYSLPWLPLGLAAIDDARRTGRAVALWKLTLASAMCFLAGYPPIWFVFLVCVGTYTVFSTRSPRILIGTAIAIGSSLLLVMVQLLPALEAATFKEVEMRYGAGVKDIGFFISLLAPNYHDFAMDVEAVRGNDCYYVGGAAMLGLLVFLQSWRREGVRPAMAVGVVSLILLTNPYGLVWAVIQHSQLIGQVCRAWYFIAGISLAIASLSAWGIDALLRRGSRSGRRPNWLVSASATLLLCYAIWVSWVWISPSQRFEAGWGSAVYPVALFFLVLLGLLTLGGTERGRDRIILTVVILLAVGADLKAFGTSKSFSARPGTIDEQFQGSNMRGMSDSIFEEIRAQSHYRIAVDVTGPFPQKLRHWALTSPQGFDPLITAQYKRFLGDSVEFSEPVTFHLDPANEELLRTLGVRYFITSQRGPLFQQLTENPKYRLLGEGTDYYQTFELEDATPPFFWDSSDASSGVRLEHWAPALRRFQVSSGNTGIFVLSEHFYPGWHAAVDGEEATIDRWHGVFQSVSVPAGSHTIEFSFKSRSFRLGAVVSGLFLVVFALFGVNLVKRGAPGMLVAAPGGSGAWRRSEGGAVRRRLEETRVRSA